MTGPTMSTCLPRHGSHAGEPAAWGRVPKAAPIGEGVPAGVVDVCHQGREGRGTEVVFRRPPQGSVADTSLMIS